MLIVARQRRAGGAARIVSVTGTGNKMQIDETEFEDELSSSAYYGEGWQIVGHTCSRYFGPEWRVEQDDDKGIVFARGMYGRNGKLEQVMRLVVQGSSIRSIIREAHVTYKTVKKCQDVLRKLLGKPIAVKRADKSDQIMRLVAQGMGTREIMCEARVSSRRVKKCRDALNEPILCKCGKSALHRGYCNTDLSRLQYLIKFSNNDESFINRFYHDEPFNKLYDKWRETGNPQYSPVFYLRVMTA